MMRAICLVAAIAFGSLLATHAASQSKVSVLCDAHRGAGKPAVDPFGTKQVDEILSAAHRRTDALKGRDARVLEQLLSPEFVYTNASGKVFDRDAYIKNYARDQTVEWTSQTLSDVCVRFVSDMAVLTAVTHDVARFGEYRLNTRFRTTQIYRRSAGGWRYFVGHTSAIE